MFLRSKKTLFPSLKVSPLTLLELVYLAALGFSTSWDDFGETKRSLGLGGARLSLVSTKIDQDKRPRSR